MEVPALLRTLFKALVLPPTGPLLVAMLGLLLLRRAPRLGRLLAWTGVTLLLLLSTPLVASWLTDPFERPPFDPASPQGAQAVVILGGGVRTRAPEYGGDTLGRLTAERLRYGARVARATGLPVLVTGGRPQGATLSEAEVMAAALRDEYGVEVRWAEANSMNTRENARRSAPLLKADGVTRIVLVAHAFDLPRACAEFAEAGLACIPAATGLSPVRGWALGDLFPRPEALQYSYYALYEYAALGERMLLRR